MMTAPSPDPPAGWYIAPDEDERPSIEELEEMAAEGIAQATDGCTVEPDGTCPHGAESWLLVAGWI